MRKSAWLGGLLDGVNIASLALIAAVIWQLGRTSSNTPLDLALVLIYLALLIRFKLNSTWLIGAGVLFGLLKAYLH